MFLKLTKERGLIFTNHWEKVKESDNCWFCDNQLL